MIYSHKLRVRRQLGTEQFEDVVASPTVTPSTTALPQDCGHVFKTDDIMLSRELVIGMRDRHVLNTNVAKTMGR